MKKIYLIHGWDGRPTNNWFPWLKTKLEAEGFEVVVPAMPQADEPKKSLWVEHLRMLEPNPDENVYFVGHSMGCQAIQRYLEAIPDGSKIGGAVFVAGWINDPRWEGRTEEELNVVNDWFGTPKNYERMKQRCSKFISIFSTDDPFIPKTNWKQAETELDSEILIIENMGHFDDEKGIKELPPVLEAVLKISK